jgi:predicted nucleic acid-binding protein
LSEFEVMLRNRRNLSPSDANRVVGEVRAFSRLVTIANVLQMVSADAGDDKVLECAVVGGANYIVTCDRNHLLPLVRYHGIAIVSPTSFLSTMSTW